VVVTFALCSALAFALASVLQQREAVVAPAEHSMRLGLLTHLATRPLWLAGLAADGAGYLLQVLALNHGSLALVQPVLACGLLFALMFNRSPGRRGLRKRDWGAAAAIAGGLGVFVVAGHPIGTRSADVGDTAWFLFASLTGLALIVCVMMAARCETSWKAVLLALGCGIAFGLASAFTKQAIFEFHEGLLQVFQTPYLYGLLVFAAVGMLLSQSAFQAASLAASLPTQTLSEPVYAAVAGALLFGEHLRGGGLTVLALLGAAAAAAGVVFLARSPRALPVLAP
jgi:drug/metabolite transporter (DMT)-like permease